MDGMADGTSPDDLARAELPLARDDFFRSVIGELAGTLQDVVGTEEASGFVSVVGQRLADEIDGAYRKALGVPVLEAQSLGAVLVDLKRRIGGDFEVLQQDETQIVLGNRRCPFGDKVLGRPALCMMTSNVFGSLAAESVGQARVMLEKTIAQGDGHCRVVVQLQPAASALAAEGARTYFRR